MTTTFTKEDRDTAIEKAQKAVEKAREGFEGSRLRFEAHVETYGRALYRLRVAELMPVDGAEVPIQTPCVHDDSSKPKGVKLIIPDPPTADIVAANIDERLGLLRPPMAEEDMVMTISGKIAGPFEVTGAPVAPVNPFAAGLVTEGLPANPFAVGDTVNVEPPLATAPTIDERAQAASAVALARSAEQERDHALAGLPLEKRERVAAALAGVAPTPPINPFAGM